MERLSYDTLEKLGYSGYVAPRDLPEKVLQFGEGNFLRAFVDNFFDRANEAGTFGGKIVAITPIDSGTGLIEALNAQDGLYTVVTRGRRDGVQVDERRIVSSVSRFLSPFVPEHYAQIVELACSPALELIVSNTTEAGIAYDPSCSPADEPPTSFPAKLAVLLHKRWEAGQPGVIVLSCELIDHNGAELLRIVKQHVSDWGWEPAFAAWLENDCTFCTTLVDTIVPGRMRDADDIAAFEAAQGYADPCAAVREPFEMWGIEGDEALEAALPFKRGNISGVFVTPDVTPFKKRKVRILNGAHTAFVPGAWLAGFEIVRDCMHDAQVAGFMDALLQDEVMPTLAADLDVEDCRRFAATVRDRFDNPFIDHQLLSICLNSVAKWTARDLPTLLDYCALEGTLPRRLSASLAFLLAFYTTGFEGHDADGLHLRRADGTAYVAQDDPAVLAFFAEHAADDPHTLVHAALAQEAFWGQNLLQVEGLADAVAADLELIRAQGAAALFAVCNEGASAGSADDGADNADNGNASCASCEKDRQ